MKTILLWAFVIFGGSLTILSLIADTPRQGEMVSDFVYQFSAPTRGSK